MCLLLDQRSDSNQCVICSYSTYIYIYIASCPAHSIRDRCYTYPARKMSILFRSRSPMNRRNRGTTDSINNIEAQIQDTERFKILVKLRTGLALQVGKTIILDVEASDSLNDIKAKIQDKEGIASEHQQLVFDALVLDDGRHTLADYNINDQATLYLHEQWEITIMHISGREHRITANLGTCVTTIKRRISENELVDMNKIQLLLGTVILKDWSILKDYNVQKESILTMVISEPS